MLGIFVWIAHWAPMKMINMHEESMKKNVIVLFLFNDENIIFSKVFIRYKNENKLA